MGLKRTDEFRQENERLRRENRILKEEREILKTVPDRCPPVRGKNSLC